MKKYYFFTLVFGFVCLLLATSTQAEDFSISLSLLDRLTLLNHNLNSITVYPIQTQTYPYSYGMSYIIDDQYTFITYYLPVDEGTGAIRRALARRDVTQEHFSNLAETLRQQDTRRSLRLRLLSRTRDGGVTIQ